MTDSQIQPLLRTRLCVMMFLQFFIWGAWNVTLGTYLSEGLSFDGTQIGRMYSTLPWGAVIAPFIVGMIADRYFSAQHVMAFMHATGGVLMLYASSVTESTHLFWVLIGYAICYNPTIALANAISFGNLKDPEKQFPAIRVFGTIGWIVAGIAIGYLKIEDQNTPMKIAAGCSFALAIYSLFLPKTPPRAADGKTTISSILGLETLQLMKNRSFAAFILGSLLICIPLAFYYSFTNLFLNDLGVEKPAAKMAMGQISELIFLLLLPFIYTRLGIKKVLVIGMAFWAIRYLLFAFGNADSLVWMLYLGIILHGICYDFFFVTGQIYVAKVAPKKVLAQAQGFITFITYGVGMVIGSNLSGAVVSHFTKTTGSLEAAVQKVTDWQGVWVTTAVIAGTALLFFASLFREKDAQPITD